MQRRRLLFSLLLLTLLWPAFPGYAQNQELPLVVFILDDEIQPASVVDPGPDGLTQLEHIFKGLGARTEYTSLTHALPEEAHVVVLVRPRYGLSVPALARLWVHLIRGNHLLLALDPVGHAGVQSEPAWSGVATLFAGYYGISLQNTFIVEPWFTLNSIATPRTTYSWTYAESFVRHPVIEPIAAHELPVQIWGARSILVDPFGPDSIAAPLIYTRTAYGEANQQVLVWQGDDRASLEINLDQDSLGTLIIGALAENTATGSRIVVLGDSEIVENNYGLGLSTFGGPLHPGNQILAERLAAWLLELPMERWSPLPAGFTWLSIDGAASDWESEAPLFVVDEDDESSAPIPAYDIQQARIFQDDSFLYLLVETAASPDTEKANLTLGLDTNSDGATDATLVATAAQVILVDDEDNQSAVPDGYMAAGDVLEARFPLRVTGEGARVGPLCLSDNYVSPTAEVQDCVALPVVTIPTVDTRAPHDTYLPPGLLVTVFSSGATQTVNLRASASENSPVLTTLTIGYVLKATGRNETGDWIQVQNAHYAGWLAKSVLLANGDLSALPVVQGP